MEEPGFALEGRKDQSLWDLLKLSESSEREQMMANVLALTLSWQIRGMRKDRGWSLEQTAERSGLSYVTVSRLETPSGVIRSSVNSLIALGKAFEVALVVRFSDWKEWLEQMLTREAFIPAPFNRDILLQAEGGSTP